MIRTATRDPPEGIFFASTSPCCGAIYVGMCCLLVWSCRSIRFWGIPVACHPEKKPPKSMPIRTLSVHVKAVLGHAFALAMTSQLEIQRVDNGGVGLGGSKRHLRYVAEIYGKLRPGHIVVSTAVCYRELTAILLYRPRSLTLDCMVQLNEGASRVQDGWMRHVPARPSVNAERNDKGVR